MLKYLSDKEKLIYVDIGAHKGHFFDLIKSCRKIERAVLVEPIPNLFNDLSLKYKSDINISVVNKIIMDETGYLDFFINKLPETSSIYKFKESIKEIDTIETGISKKISASACSLDELAKETSVNHIDLLKIDVQGAEHLVLNNGDTILKNTKLIWIEVSFKPLYEGSSTFFDIYNILDKKGFALIEIHPGYRSSKNELLQADALFRKI
ncbi:MAG: FkbM family methyltransferase [Bacteroidota bacterium]|nr:FkbM family methyltransferase [Bacteroidota bacterium]